MTEEAKNALIVHAEYQLTVTASGLRIEVLDYHAKVRKIPWAQLALIGIEPPGDRPSTTMRDPVLRTQLHDEQSTLSTVMVEPAASRVNRSECPKSVHFG